MKPVRFAPLLAVVLAACSAQAPVHAPPRPSTSQAYEVQTPEALARIESEYAALEARVRMAPTTEDVKRLRELYIRTSRYQPYGADGFPPQSMFDAMDAKRWGDCLAEAEKQLARNYVDMNAHLGAMVCNREDGRQKESEHHKAILRSLLDVISASGDGKSEKTAFVTYSTPELYAFLGLNDLQTVSQALGDKDGQWFDIMHVKDRETGKELSLYFDITWQWGKEATADATR